MAQKILPSTSLCICQDIKLSAVDFLTTVHSYVCMQLLPTYVRMYVAIVIRSYDYYYYYYY